MGFMVEHVACRGFSYSDHSPRLLYSMPAKMAYVSHDIPNRVLLRVLVTDLVLASPGDDFMHVTASDVVLLTPGGAVLHVRGDLLLGQHRARRVRLGRGPGQRSA